MSSPFDEGTERVSADRRGLEILSVELCVVEGPDRGARVRIDRGTARIGTAAGNDLRLRDPTVSRIHCEIGMAKKTIRVRDTGSTNGTWVEGVRIYDAELSAGAILHLGNTAVRIEVGGAPVFLELSNRVELGELVGSSVEMRRVYAILERTAPTDSTILLQGETGTGKDVVARTIHALSPRAQGPFVPIDCGAVPDNLIESELFGHVKGAFSGAVSNRIGVFEEAHGGTLFLDEVGEMPLSMQSKLLRAIESRKIRPVGSNVERAIDVRIIAATNRGLSLAVNDGRFREDLYYRLAVVEVTLPSLRSRRSDIRSLAERFFDKLGPKGERPSPDFLDSLEDRPWPGNVRELRNTVERAISLGYASASPAARSKAPDVPNAKELESIVPLHLPLKDARQVWVERFESVYLVSMLRATGGNVTRAAERAGVSRRFLQRLAQRLGIKASDVGSDQD
jgi:transcriptional regulator with PAS, ATPase and Fis domain